MASWDWRNDQRRQKLEKLIAEQLPDDLYKRKRKWALQKIEADHAGVISDLAGVESCTEAGDLREAKLYLDSAVEVVRKVCLEADEKVSSEWLHGDVPVDHKNPETWRIEDHANANA